MFKYYRHKNRPSEFTGVDYLYKTPFTIRMFIYLPRSEQIGKIQDQISNGCIQKEWYNPYWCQGGGNLRQCAQGTWNESLANLDYVFYSPGYGKVVPQNTVGNPERIQVDTCSTYTYPHLAQTTRHFCLFYTIECPLCPAVRVQSAGS